MAVLLEGRNGVEREFVIRVYLYGRARYYPARYRFVALEKVLGQLRRNSNQMCFEVFGVLDDQARRDNGGERFIR